MPGAEVDEVSTLKPASCARCQQPWDGDAPQPQRHQVCEIPSIRPVVTESHVHRLVCTACADATQAAWPAAVPTGMDGPRAHAVAARCPGVYRLSQRTTHRVLDDLWELPMSLGTLSHVEVATTQAVAAPVEEARPYVQKPASAH